MNETHIACDKRKYLNKSKTIRLVKLLERAGKNNKLKEETLDYFSGQDWDINGDIGDIWIKACPSLTKSHLFESFNNHKINLIYLARSIW